MTSPLDIGQQLVATRIATGVTQRELARRVGVKQPQIARWEANAYRSAALERVDDVARALGVDIGVTLPLAAEAPATYNAPSLADTGARALARLGVAPETVAAFCRLHGVRELALFGSSVRTDFEPESDVDVLVTWAEDAEPLDFGTLDDLSIELRGIFRRDVDLVDRESVERSENYIRKSRILDGARSVYVAR
ncbi:MAG: helix-turn-helix domain-containing protein [Coriobacteriia bacterium]|nr:helix-turn-helix domain-containing protein [Coriobacteriia bacterium]